MKAHTFAIALVVIFTAAPFALAASTTINPGSFQSGVQSTTVNPGSGSNNVTLINPLGPGITTLEDFLNAILDFVIRIGIIVIVLMMVYIGFMFVTARGDPKKIEDARRMLLYTVIGALILLGAKGIALGIQATAHQLQVGGY